VSIYEIIEKTHIEGELKVGVEGAVAHLNFGGETLVIHLPNHKAFETFFNQTSGYLSQRKEKPEWWRIMDERKKNRGNWEELSFFKDDGFQ